jgi:hypothetical protein
MTSDEMQRAIEFLLSSQANFEVRFEKTSQQLAQTDSKVAVLAETQTEFIRTMLQHVEAQREINADMRQTMLELAQAQKTMQQGNTDVRQTMRELAQVQKTTQQEISDLTKIVGGLVRTVYKNGNPLQE